MPGFGKYNLKKIFPKKVRFLTVVLLLVVNPWFWDLRRGFRPVLNFSSFETIFKLTPEDILQINTRRSYYPNQLLGKIFENKLVFYLDKYEENFFQGLDLNFYFFANHPRERVGVVEKEIFFWFWLPLFLVGIVTSFKKSLWMPSFLSFFVLLTISVFSKFDNFVILLIPFLIFYIYLGLKTLTNT